jgi:hypothetical protein
MKHWGLEILLAGATNHIHYGSRMLSKRLAEGGIRHT